MNVDVRAQHAAQALLSECAQVDTESGLESLRSLNRRRTSERGMAGLVAALVMAFGIWTAWPQGQPEVPPPVAPISKFPPLGDAFDVVQTAVSPTGRMQAVAALRDGQPAVVLVRHAGGSDLDFVWNATTPHEQPNQNPQSPVAIGWAPDEDRLAVVVAQVPSGVGADPDVADLTLLTMNADGTDRDVVDADLGACRCAEFPPTLDWSHDGQSIQVDVPNGTGPASYTVEVS